MARPKKKGIAPKFFLQIVSYRIVGSICRSHFGGKNLTLYLFFWFEHFFKTPNCHLKNPCKFFPQIGSYKSIQQLCRRQFEKKNLAQYLFSVCFLGLDTFFKPQIVAQKNPLIIKSIYKQKENQ